MALSRKVKERIRCNKQRRLLRYPAEVQASEADVSMLRPYQREAALGKRMPKIFLYASKGPTGVSVQKR